MLLPRLCFTGQIDSSGTGLGFPQYMVGTPELDEVEKKQDRVYGKMSTTNHK